MSLFGNRLAKVLGYIGCTLVCLAAVTFLADTASGSISCGTTGGKCAVVPCPVGTTCLQIYQGTCTCFSLPACECWL